MQPLVSSRQTKSLSRRILVLYAWRSVPDLAVVSGWLSSGLVPLSGIQKYSISGSLYQRLLRVLILAVFGLIRGDIDANMQGIEGAIQSSHAHARDTCVVSSWPTAHSNTAINHLILYKTY